MNGFTRKQNKVMDKATAITNSAQKGNQLSELLKSIQEIGQGETGGERLKKIAEVIGLGMM